MARAATAFTTTVGIEAAIPTVAAAISVSVAVSIGSAADTTTSAALRNGITDAITVCSTATMRSILSILLDDGAVAQLV